MNKHKKCFVCAEPLTSRRAIYGKTTTCSTDCGVLLREINTHGKVWACTIASLIDWSVGSKTEIQSFINWSVGYKTNMKSAHCLDCAKPELVKSKATRKRCKTCGPRHTNKSAKIKHKEKLVTNSAYRLKHNARLARIKHLRRSLHKDGDVIDLYELTERDNWQCQICLSPIDRHDQHIKGRPHLQGPSLDHIIPVSKGGSHTWGNVQLAHFLCNSLRGNADLVRSR